MIAEVAESNRKTKREKRRSLIRLTEAQAVLGWGVVLALIALLGAIYLFQASRIASTGRMVQELQYDLDELKRLNSELELDIAEAQSLKRLQREAKKLGFVRAQPEDVEYLIVLDYPHLRESNPESDAESPSEPFNDFRSAFIRFVISNVDDLVRGESP